MGLDTASVQFLCAAKSCGVNFERTAMIGRQSFFPEASKLARVFSVLGSNQDAKAFLQSNSYSESYFKALGAKEVTSVDYSSYENATVIHDMNTAIQDNLKAKFSAVYDGGTIEHVFNVTQALKNCMEMVELGGYFLQSNIANNFMGHGFWQFSPEMLFRVFSPENGFKVKAVLLHEVVKNGAWCVVKDPNEIRRRVTLCNSNPTYVLTIAQRVGITEIFARTPQQSDYVTVWEGAQTNGGGARSPQQSETFKTRLRVAVHRFKPLARNLTRAIRGPFHDSCYIPVSEDAVIRGQFCKAVG